MKSRTAIRRTVVVLTIGIAALVLLSTARAPGRERKEIAPKELYWPLAPAAPRIQFLSSFSSPKDLKLKRTSFFKGLIKKIVGIEDRELRMVFPYGLITDSAGRLIAVDTKSRLVHVFDLKQKAYLAIKPPKPERFVSPIGVAVDAADNIYVSDFYQGKIFIFDRQGKRKDVIGRPEGRFKRSTGLAIDPAEGRLYGGHSKRWTNPVCSRLHLHVAILVAGQPLQRHRVCR